MDTPPPAAHSTSPFQTLGPDILERILSHLAGESLETSALTTDAIRLLLPFAQTCTAHYHLTTQAIRRLSILPLRFTLSKRPRNTVLIPFPPTTPLTPPSNSRVQNIGKIPALHLSRILTTFPNIRVLHLSLAMPVTDDALQSAAPRLATLRELHIRSSHHLTHVGLSVIAEHCTSVQVLNLSYAKRLGDECAPILATMPQLASLDVTRWDISDHFVQQVAQLPSLRHLSLSACSRLSAQSCRYLMQNAIQLQHLKFRCAPGLQDHALYFLQGCTRLEVLDLTLARNLTDEGVAALGDVDMFPRLEKVLLSQCRYLSDAGVRELVRNSNIRELDLSYCELLTDKTAVLLRRLLLLEELDLSGCQNITDDGVFAITKFPRLLRLRITNCHGLTDRSTDAISRAACCVLEEVEVCKCSGISTDALLKLRGSSAMFRS